MKSVHFIDSLLFRYSDMRMALANRVVDMWQWLGNYFFFFNKFPSCFHNIMRIHMNYYSFNSGLKPLNVIYF